ncbi:MAG: hypothetical protein ACREGR_02710 [Minisyncoccia bacterium]
MDMNENLIKGADIREIAEKGLAIYAGMKDKYEPAENGRFLAIDIGSKEVYLADSSADALETARTAHPGNIFYVVRIGYDSAEAMARAFTHVSYA